VVREKEITRGFWFALVLAGCLAGTMRISAQSSAGGDDAAGSSQNKSASQTAPQTGSNPFPVDTSNVPVMPSSGTAAVPEGTGNGADSGAAAIAGEDSDPARSPDDAAPASGDGNQESSSLTGLDRLVPAADDEPTGRKGKQAAKEPEHQETASEDINVGSYYLDEKNWKAALSRYQSAMVLDPENPDVYWGLAEAERNLGQFAGARAHYQRVVDYDPDSKHGKEARKALKEPKIANAASGSAGQPTVGAAK
jgi:hypothetical protein